MGSRRRCDERGMVTAELAIGTLVFCFLAVLGVWTINLVLVQTRCSDVASQVARQLARGDADAAEAAKQRAPQGSSMQVRQSGRLVGVSVDVDSSLGRVGPVHLHGQAVADVEPGVSR